MSISALGSTNAAPVRAPQGTSERLEAPGPDNDGDSDDVGAAAASAVKAAPPKGMGSIVDVSF